MPQYVGQVYVGVSFDTAGAGRALGQSLGAAANQAGDAMNKSLSSKMLAFGTQATRVGRQLSFGISAPLLALGHAADTAFQSFDTQMTKVAALTGVGIAQTNAWSDSVLDLAAKYGQTGEDAAKALYLITSSGIKGADAMAALDVTGQAAAVGLGDMQTIAGLLTSAMNAYGTETLSAAKAADILAGAVQESKIPADQLAGSISQLLPIASQLGIGFDQVVGSMAALSLQGTNAAMGATQLRGILNGMLDPSSQAAEALNKVGLSVEDVQKTMESQGIVAGVRQIRDAIVANGGESDAALAEVFGNVRALTGVFGLLNDEGGKVDRVLSNTTNSAGKLAAELKVTADTPGFKAQQATQELNNEMVKLGASITPIKTLFAQAAGAALGFFNMFGPLKPIIVGFGTLLAVAGPIAYSIGAIADVAGLGAALLAKMGLIGQAAASEETVATEANTTAMGELTLAIEAVTESIIVMGTAGEEAMLALGSGTLATEEAMAGLGGVGANSIGSLDAELAAATAEMEGLAAATAEETAGLETADVAGSALMSTLLPIVLIVASIGAAWAVANHQLDVNRDKASEIGDIFSNNVAQGNIENAQQEIEKAKQQIDALKADADSTWNPFTKQADADLAVELGKRIQATQQNLKWVDELSQKTDQNKEVTFQWLSAQSNAGVVFKDVDAALQAYGADVVKHGGQITAATTATGKLVDKAKDLASSYFGLHDAQQGFEESLRAIGDAQQGVLDAEKSAAGARRDEAAAIRNVTTAQEAHRDALLKVADAQRELTDARKTYDELLAGPTKDEKLDVRQAQLSLRRAQQGLSKSSSDPLDRQQAQLDVQRARMALDDARGAHAKNLAKAQADVTTAEKNVTSAQKDVVTSAEGIVTAQQGVLDSHDKVVAADKNVEDAHRKVETASWDAARAADELAHKQSDFDDAVHKSNTQLDPFLQYLEQLKTQYPLVADSIQPIIDKVDALNKAAKPPPPPPAAGSLPQGEIVTIDGEDYAVIPGIGIQKIKRQFGGPVGAGQLASVNEGGIPELWSSGGKQYLMPLKAGKVIPLKAGAVKGGDGASISVGDIYVQGAENPTQTAYEVRRQLRVKTRTRGRI